MALCERSGKANHHIIQWQLRLTVFDRQRSPWLALTEKLRFGFRPQKIEVIEHKRQTFRTFKGRGVGQLKM